MSDFFKKHIASEISQQSLPFLNSIINAQCDMLKKCFIT